MKKIAAVIGDFYHHPESIHESMGAALQQLDERAAVSYVKVTELKDAIAKQPDLIVLYAENRIDPREEQSQLWMTKELEADIAQYVQNGGRWLAWHSGMASFPLEGDYVKMLRGHFAYHPDQQTVKYTAAAEQSLIRKDTTFEFMDEHYFVECDEANTQVFLRSESVDGSSIAGWHHDYGQGRVYCLAPAHNCGGLLNRDFLHVLTQVFQGILE